MCPCVHSQGRSARKFDASAASADNKLRIRLITASLKMERKFLGSVPRSYAGIKALALLLSERLSGVIKCARFSFARVSDARC